MSVCTYVCVEKGDIIDSILEDLASLRNWRFRPASFASFVRKLQKKKQFFTGMAVVEVINQSVSRFGFVVGF